LSYCNASHEPPILLNAGKTDVTRDSFTYLSEINNPRLGQELDYDFKDTSIQLQDGDQLVFYTDGIYDIADPDERRYGERKFMKSLAQTLVMPTEPQSKVAALVEDFETFRAGTELDDDVTLVLCQYKKSV
jgi:sigma-B regulation protein RsbU (phosphoserine phosphatase)